LFCWKKEKREREKERETAKTRDIS